MIKFNETNIITGFIKQLLTSFNLPYAKPYVKDKTILYNNILVIKDNYIMQYKKDTDEFVPLIPYVWNHYQPNYTRTLVKNNIIYDSHTHEYLGEYLRFLRDFKNLDLMSLYNCFSDRILTSAQIPLIFNNNTLEYTRKDFSYFATNDKYKVYAIPVKFNEKYTLAIDAPGTIELFCGFLGKDYYFPSFTDSEKTKPNLLVETMTFKRATNLTFNKPILIGSLAAENLINKLTEEHWQHEECLHLFLKVPTTFDSTITLLEGDYVNAESRVLDSRKEPSTVVTTGTYNSAVINFADDTIDFKDLKFISSLQLLSLNSKISHPFADRLVEYLVDNVISSIDTIPDNITRLQYMLGERHEKGKSGLLQDYSDLPGIWKDKYRRVLYSIMQREGKLNSISDILGYVDKDTEKVLLADEVDIYKD